MSNSLLAILTYNYSLIIYGYLFSLLVIFYFLVRVGRFRIAMDGRAKGELESALDPNEHGRGMDMCSINPDFLGKKYRYAYACGAQRPCNFPNSITKVTITVTTHLIIFNIGLM